MKGYQLSFIFGCVIGITSILGLKYLGIDFFTKEGLSSCLYIHVTFALGIIVGAVK